MGTELAPLLKAYMKLEAENKLSEWNYEEYSKKLLQSSSDGTSPMKLTLADPKAMGFGDPYRFDDFIDSKLNALYASTPHSPKLAEVINMWQGHEVMVDLVIGEEGSVGCGEVKGKQQCLLYQVRGEAHVLTLKRKLFLKEGCFMLIESFEGKPILTQVPGKEGEKQHGATVVIRNCLEAVA